jgi:hypothetical protein
MQVDRDISSTAPAGPVFAEGSIPEKEKGEPENARDGLSF